MANKVASHLICYLIYPIFTLAIYAAEYMVTKATPGRRYVKLAQLLGDMGYISSICNQDWEDVMKEIAKLITCNVLK